MNCLNKEENPKDFFEQIIMERGKKRGPSIRTKYRAEIFDRLESFKLKHMFQPLLIHKLGNFFKDYFIKIIMIS